MSEAKRTFVGTAGWATSGAHEAFPGEGSALQRYAAVFDGVEINSSFHRRHRPATWQRWAESTPEQFRFAVKVPKTITHSAKLVDVHGLVDDFIDGIRGLGQKLSVVLVQLPPSLHFDDALAEGFFARLSALAEARIACEPRHASWFEPGAEELLGRLGVARVAADPALNAAASKPGGAGQLAYWRLHGSPHIYRSKYGEARIADYAARIARSAATECWCMFDNTASSSAIDDALLMTRIVDGLSRASSR